MERNKWKLNIMGDCSILCYRRSDKNQYKHKRTKLSDMLDSMLLDYQDEVLLKPI